MEKVWKIKDHQVMKGKGNDRKFLCVKGNANSLLKEKYSIEKLTKFPKYSLERTMEPRSKLTFVEFSLCEPSSNRFFVTLHNLKKEMKQYKFFF